MKKILTIQIIIILILSLTSCRLKHEKQYESGDILYQLTKDKNGNKVAEFAGLSELGKQKK